MFDRLNKELDHEDTAGFRFGTALEKFAAAFGYLIVGSVAGIALGIAFLSMLGIVRW